MKSRVTQAAKAVGVVAVGATMGYVAGVLTAPDSGAQTRRKIGRKISDATSTMKGRAQRAAGHLKDRAQETAGNLKSKAEQALQDAKEKLPTIGRRGEQALYDVKDKLPAGGRP